ncbi:MAG: DUF4388 domain-containing protein [Kofleriaceae bacterium]
MTSSKNHPSVLIVCHAAELDELSEPLRQPMSTGALELYATDRMDDALAWFAGHRPEVLVVSATQHAIAAQLVERVRAEVGRAEVSVVVIGEQAGPVSTALDAAELGGDRFVARPLSPKALRYAVAVSIDAARLARGGRVSAGVPQELVDEPTDYRQAQRARWARLADSIVDGIPVAEARGEAERRDKSQPVLIQPRRHSGPIPVLQPGSAPTSAPASLSAALSRELGAEAVAPARAPTPAPEAVAPARAPTPAPREDGVVATSLEDEPAVWSAPALLAQLHRAVDAAPAVAPAVPAQPPASREFARQLRQKMSVMAQRLFAHQGSTSGALDAAPRHGHQIEFDLAALVEEPVLAESPKILGPHTILTPPPRETQPGSWDVESSAGPSDAHLPDFGELSRGAFDAPTILVRMRALGATGRVVFHRGESEKIVYFDQGRPVFASSTELHDRMGELLYREGKITHGQYMHSKSLVAESGRRMGEVLVELGYLKRRELFPAVRRHVEDIIYSLFAWDHGTYRVSLEERATTERIRLSRHPEALVLEGIRRKLDRDALERLVGPPSTVLEPKDRDRLRALPAAIELTPEERAAVAAMDGQADLPAVARAAGLALPALLPLAWALIVLGYVSARRDAIESADEHAPLGEADLAIDRERVRARWQLVAEADYFTLLGVRRDATSFEIRRAYEAARRDFAAEGFAAELRRELTRELDDISTVIEEAFRVLRDEPLRREYLANLMD